MFQRIKNLKAHKEIELVVSVSNLKKLEKDTINQKFQLVPLIDPTQEKNSAYLTGIKNELFNKLSRIKDSIENIEYLQHR